MRALSPATGNTRCAIYTRQSREFTGEFSSCDAQFDVCLGFVRANAILGWRWNDLRYDDKGESGNRRDRPGLMRLLADIASGDVDRVVIYRLDRLSRSLLHGTTILQELRDRKVELTIVTSPELGCSAQDTFALNILASFAEFELEMPASGCAKPERLASNTASASPALFPSGTKRIRTRSNWW